jgi:hypothetical protein
METFTEPKELVENSRYAEQRQNNLSGFTEVKIDPPIIEIIDGFNKLPYCFTLQSCYGHFLYPGQKTSDNLKSLPVSKSIDRVDYRIAYIAFCIENSESGKRLFQALRDIPLIDPDNIQFCSAEWFWKRQVNSYALQVEPDRFKHQDRALLDYQEALYIEKIRNEFFVQLGSLIGSPPI